MKYINVNKEVPKERYKCIVLMWDVFTNKYEKGIGIYHPDDETWETASLIGYKSRVDFWYKIPNVPKNLRFLSMPGWYESMYDTLKYDNFHVTAKTASLRDAGTNNYPQIERAIEYFEEKGEYEKCAQLMHVSYPMISEEILELERQKLNDN
jgi:hypothetical protein